MLTLIPVLVVGSIVVIVLVGLAGVQEWKRTNAVTEFAGQWGLQSRAELDERDLALLRRFVLGSKGRETEAMNAVAADDGGLVITVFDYKYVIFGGHVEQVNTQTVTLVQHRGLQLPQFLLQPKTFTHKLEHLIGRGGIRFPEDATFSRNSMLSGDNEIVLRTFFSERRRACFTELDEAIIEGCGDAFIIYRPSKRILVANFHLLFEEALQVFERLS